MKKLSANKPDPVILILSERPSFILPYHYWQGLAAYPPTLLFQTSNEPLSGAGVHGITAHKVYPIIVLLQ